MLDEWQAVEEIPQLGADEVQVWRIDLADAMRSEAEYLRMLPPDEVERAERLRAGQVRMQFLAGRSFVRRLLGRELGIAGRTVRITTGAYGKPETPAVDGKRLHFNVAHSRSTVLVALSRAGAVGVDVEYLDRDAEVMEVARHALTATEIDAVQAITDINRRRRAFFTCWTRKEAVVKADGRGLSLPLTSFEVPVGGVCQSEPLVVHDPAESTDTRYFVSDIDAHGGTASAIAVSGQPSRLRLLVATSAL
jgi:4'-phosphopantetheinyl transferase